jgi:uncharacterized protein YabN with tetrapyrrole methylase and pyrophosphatase domain
MSAQGRITFDIFLHAPLINYTEFVEKLFKKMDPALMKAHCAMGAAGEAGELSDAIKKDIIYGKPVDIVNIREELGDLLFYLVATMLVYQLKPEDVIADNYEKLKTRYQGLVYTDAAAQYRADKNQAQVAFLEQQGGSGEVA